MARLCIFFILISKFKKAFLCNLNLSYTYNLIMGSILYQQAAIHKALKPTIP